MHRVAVIGAGTLDSLPHNGAVVTLARGFAPASKPAWWPARAISTSSWSAIVGPIVALVAVIALGSTLGSF